MLLFIYTNSDSPFAVTNIDNNGRVMAYLAGTLHDKGIKIIRQDMTTDSRWITVYYPLTQTGSVHTPLVIRGAPDKILFFWVDPDWSSMNI